MQMPSESALLPPCDQVNSPALHWQGAGPVLLPSYFLSQVFQAQVTKASSTTCLCNRFGPFFQVLQLSEKEISSPIPPSEVWANSHTVLRRGDRASFPSAIASEGWGHLFCSLTFRVSSPTLPRQGQGQLPLMSQPVRCGANSLHPSHNDMAV